MQMSKNTKKRFVVEFKTIRECLEYSCRKYENETAFILKEKNHRQVSYKNITYKETLADIYAFSTYLADQGFERSTVAITGINSYEYLIAHFGAVFADHISVPIDKELKVNELQFCIEESKAEILVYDQKSEKKVLEVLEKADHNVKLAICTKPSEVNVCFADCVAKGHELIAGGTAIPASTKDPDEMAMLLFTSGTTSNAKAVMLSNHNVAANVYGLDVHLDQLVTKEDVNLAFLPFHHTFGITGTTLTMYFGCTNVFCDGLKYIADNLVEYKVSLFITVPLLLEAMQKKILKAAEKTGKLPLLKLMMKVSNGLNKIGIDVRRKLFKSVLDQLGGALRLAVVGAAPIDAEVGKFYDSLGILAIQGYGLTETSPVLSAENRTTKRPGSIGKPLPNVQMEVLNPDAEGLGEIICKAPNVMLGYTKDEFNEEVFHDGWFYTGDLGYKDDDGFFYIKGRKKNVIVLKNGKNVYPEELEDLLVKALPEVNELLVFGWEKDDDLLVSANFVVDQALIDEMGEDKLKQRLLDAVTEINATLPPYKLIRRLLLSTEAMEKTSTQKVRRPRVVPELQKRTDYF